MAAHVGKIAMTPRPGKRDAALCFRGRLWERLRLERWRWHRPVVEAVVIAAEAKRGRHDGRTCWRANDEICAPEEGEQACLCKQPFGSLRQLLTPSLRPLPPMRTAKLLAGRRPVQARDRSAAQHGGAQHGCTLRRRDVWDERAANHAGTPEFVLRFPKGRKRNGVVV